MDDVTGAPSTSTGASSSSGGTGSSTASSGGSTSGTASDTDATTGNCPAVYDPVCGRDGETYDNACVVPEGVGIRREGPCVGDCEGTCTVVGSPQLSLVFSLLVLLLLRGRG